MSPFAAVATDKGYVFFGGEPEVMNTPKDPRTQKNSMSSSDDDFVPSFMSNKVSALRDSLASMKECLLRAPFSKYYSFSVNDCPRKIHAKNEKRRNRKNKQNYKDSVYAS